MARKKVVAASIVNDISSEVIKLGKWALAWDFMQKYRVVIVLIVIAVSFWGARWILGSIYQRGEITGAHTLKSGEPATYKLKQVGYLSQITWHLVDGSHIQQLDEKSREIEIPSLVTGNYHLVCVTSNIFGHQMISRAIKVGSGPGPGPSPKPRPGGGNDRHDYSSITTVTSQAVSQIRSSRVSSQSAALAKSLTDIANRIDNRELSEEQQVLDEVGAAYKRHTDSSWKRARDQINKEIQRLYSEDQISGLSDWSQLIRCVVEGLQSLGDVSGDDVQSESKPE